ncbi:MAG TPA: SHOCT domain-containing protein [Solirubrobacteraceae bacterium]|nr:SHOCT domain-containing protein [Solirubrobacteraceae bacterium]
MFYMHNVGWGWEFLMVIGMVLIWALVLYAFIGLVRGAGDRRSEPSAPDGTAETPLQILDRRLASGDITIEEYQARRDALEHRELTGTHS